MSLATVVELFEQECYQHRTFPAGALAIGEGGHLVLAHAVGAGAVRGVHTWFDLASLTKALCTAVIAMGLYEQGHLQLTEEITALLRHRSGLPAWVPLFLLEPAQILPAIRATPREPVPKTVYSDLGFILLGSYLQERLLHLGRPGLEGTFLEIATALEADVAFRPVGKIGKVPETDCARTHGEAMPEHGIGSRRPLLGVVHDDNARALGGVCGHAGLFGTVLGVARFAQALIDVHEGRATPLASGLGLGQKTVRRFFALDETGLSSFGLGWDHPDPVGRSSAGTFWPRTGVGHLGFTGCSLWLDPPRGRYVVLLSNRVDTESQEAADASRERIKEFRPSFHDAVVEALEKGASHA